MSNRTLALCLLAGLLTLVPAATFATTPEELNPAVLFFANDPQQLAFCDINLLIDHNEAYQKERGLVTDNQVSEFFRHIRDHGVPTAGQGEAKIGVG